jgi:hypothetical protein
MLCRAICVCIQGTGVCVQGWVVMQARHVPAARKNIRLHSAFAFGYSSAVHVEGRSAQGHPQLWAG